MKHLFLMSMLSTGVAMAQPGNMQLNFGGGNVVVKANAGYVRNPVAKSGDYGRLGNSEAGMLSNFRGNANIMVMLNNHNILSCDQMSRPRYVNGGMAYDDLLKRQTFTFGYAQSMQVYLPSSYKPVKGYWSANLVILDEQKKISKGVNVAYSGYTKRYGIELSSTYTGKFLHTAILHRKVVGNFMVAAGIENNFPKAGLEYMVKFMRVSVHSTRVYDRMFTGFTTTFNL